MAAESTASLGFYTANESTLHHASDDVQQSIPICDETVLEDYYEISRCVNWINERGFKRVALQFPDRMLVDATLVTLRIRKECHGTELYVLADTSYGSCCVDEVAASHVSADALIHFGHSCLSPASHLPVLFVFGKKPLDCVDAERRFRELFPEKDTRTVIFYDVVYKHAIENMFTDLKPDYPNLMLSTVDIEQSSSVPSESRASCCQCSGKDGCTKRKDVLDVVDGVKKVDRKVQLPDDVEINQCSAFYVGEEGSCLLNLMLTFNTCPFYSYNPEMKSGRKETLSVNKLLMKRYYMIEQAKDAAIVGILIGTLGVADYRTIIEQQKKLIRDAGKRVYTLVVGKINVAKLANFPEIDVFVLIACPENSLLDSKDFFKPIVTPFEMEIACNAARSWTGDYITDFRQLLPGASSHVESLQSDNVEMSLISGRLRLSQVHDEKSETDDGQQALGLRDEMAVSQLHSNAAGEFLHGRSWKGLEVQAGQHNVKKAEEGLHGIASGYENEGQT